MPMPNSTTIRIVCKDCSTSKPNALPASAITAGATTATRPTTTIGISAATGLR